MENMDTAVPLPPDGVCFKREKFIKSNFSADIFLQDLWNTVPLEILRDDLGSYLKVLRSAMIELINRDYADFVNLSGNLVGLDVAITSLQEPLIFVQTEILEIEKILQNVHTQLEVTLSERQCVREKKLLIESIIKIPASLNNLEKLLNLTMLETINIMLEEDPTKGNVIARAANEYNLLQHLLIKCNNSQSTISDFQQRITHVNESLMKCLESTLFYGIENNKSYVLTKTLHTYATLDKSSLCVNLVRIRIVHPKFEKILNQRSLKKEPQDLNGLLTKIKHFIDTNLKEIMVISSVEGLQGFTFVEDCIWPEFSNFLVNSDLDCIFAQGDPDLFHKRYSCTMEFIQYLECFSIRGFKNDPNYSILLSRWNLPVYFQMRFQELAGSLETALMVPFKETDLSSSEGSFNCNFASSNILLRGLVSCYASDIYLPPLAHRFWKLSLQMMSRYIRKVSDRLDEQNYIEGNSTSLGTSSNQSDSDNRITETGAATGLSYQKKVNLHRLVQLDSDIRIIISKLPSICSLAVKQISVHGMLEREVFENAFQASTKGYEVNLLNKTSELIIGALSIQCASHLKHVMDIPRLFRRTNKDVPNKPSPYVDQLLLPVREFHEKYNNLDKNILVKWIHGVFKALSIQYLASVSDVLTSVQKTEESLKRLRKDRNPHTLTMGISDDDKIRMQLVIDVDSFVKEACTMSVDILLEFKTLLNAVENARSVFSK